MEETGVPDEEINQPDFLYDGNGCPCFTPSMEQFKDFYAYVKSIEKVGQKAGLIKIIPPQEWIKQQNTSIDLVASYKIKNPISQTFNCGGLPAGVQRQFNIENKKTYTVQDWYTLSKTEQFQSPVMNYQGKVSLPEIGKKRKRSNIYSDDDEDLPRYPNENLQSDDGIPEYMRTDPNLQTPEYLAAVERFYWRNVSFQNTMYGADLSGSVFTDNNENSWNVSRLENLLSRVGVAVPGVTTPYLYFGMYKSTFAWHVEDMDLFSINYIHFGAPKQWYVVPPAHKSRFERLAKSMFFTEASDCSEFLRHKTCVISPSALASAHIPVTKLVQKANEFVITFPGAYHQGFNIGFNCAESINFATPSWLNFARHAKFCECVHDSVQLDVCSIFGLEPLPVKEKAVKKKRLPSRLPFNIYIPPAPSIKKVKEAPPKLPFPKCHLCPLGHSEDFPLVPTDSPSIVAHVECGAFINETSVETLYNEQDDSENACRGKENTTIVATSAVETKLKNSNIDLSQEKSLPEEIPIASAHEHTASPSTLEHDILMSEQAKEEKQWPQPPAIAHPAGRETVAERIRRKLPDIDNSPYRVLGIADIPKARWNLKCAWCQYPEHFKGLGACVQCTKGKCVRAFHVTCALLGNIHLQMDDDGVVECLCSAHDPVVKQERKLLADQNLASVATERFKIGTPVIYRLAGNNYEGVVVECKADEKGCMTQFEERNEPIFAPWISLKVREIPKPKEKKIPVYCTPPRKKKMKQIMDLFLDKDSGLAKNLFPDSADNLLPVIQDEAPVVLPEIPQAVLPN